MDEQLEREGLAGTHRCELGPTRKTGPLECSVSNLDGVGVLQEKLVFFLTKLNRHLPQVWEKLKERPGKGKAVAGPNAASRQRGEPTNMCEPQRYLSELLCVRK